MLIMFSLQRSTCIIAVITTIVKRRIGRAGLSTRQSSRSNVSFSPSRVEFPPHFSLVYSNKRRPAPLSKFEDRSMDSAASTATQPKKAQDPTASRQSLTITDNRTGKSYEVPVTNGAIRAMDLRQIKVDPADFGMMSYDPAYNNTASCISRVTYIDGDAGILRYRGYPIEELAEKSTYLETAYLLLHGELPNAEQLKDWTYNITHHTFIHESIKKFLDGFHYDAHPMGMLISTIAALSTYYHDSKDIFSKESRQKQTYRLI